MEDIHSDGQGRNRQDGDIYGRMVKCLNGTTHYRQLIKWTPRLTLHPLTSNYRLCLQCSPVAAEILGKPLWIANGDVVGELRQFCTYLHWKELEQLNFEGQPRPSFLLHLWILNEFYYCYYRLSTQTQWICHWLNMLYRTVYQNHKRIRRTIVNQWTTEPTEYS